MGNIWQKITGLGVHIHKSLPVAMLVQVWQIRNLQTMPIHANSTRIILVHKNWITTLGDNIISTFVQFVMHMVEK